MIGTNRLLVILLPFVAALVAFWLLAISPKREEASELEREASDLQAQVDEQTQLAASAESARRDFPRAYRRLVVLGKAVPQDDDTSSLLVQLNRIAEASGIKFVSLQTEAGSGAAPAPPTPPQTPADAAESSEEKVDAAESGSSPAPPATEASAALLPIGASIGPAGLPVMKYSLSFEGDFFQLADYLDGLDDLVTTRPDGSVGVRGRLITVDSFELTPLDTTSQDPALTANFTITTFLTPGDQGITGGASPAGPAPATEPQAVSETPSSSGTTTTASTATP